MRERKQKKKRNTVNKQIDSVAQTRIDFHGKKDQISPKYKRSKIETSLVPKSFNSFVEHNHHHQINAVQVIFNIKI